MKKNLLFTFCFSFIPGAGQMYQGYMKRGVSIMSIAALFFMIAVMLGTPIFIFPFLVIYAYSFFDTFNIRNRIIQNEPHKDDYVWNSLELDGIINKLNNKKKQKIIGYILIIFGAYLIFQNILLELIYDLKLYFLYSIFNTLLHYLAPIIIAALCIYIGVKLINKSR